MHRPHMRLLLACALALGAVAACDDSDSETTTDASIDTQAADTGDLDTDIDSSSDTPSPADTEPPTVLATVPTDGGCMEVGIGEVYFALSESPMPATVFDPANVLVSATSAADGVSRDLTVTVSLAPSDAPVSDQGVWFQIEPTAESEGFWTGTIRVELTTGITDTSGNALAAPYVFTVESRC